MEECPNGIYMNSFLLGLSKLDVWFKRKQHTVSLMNKDITETNVLINISKLPTMTEEHNKFTVHECYS